MFSLKRIFSLVVCAVCAGAVCAQERDAGYADYGESGEALVVTADRIPEETARVPATVTVITAADIAESGASSVVDALSTAAGVRFSGGMAGPGSDAVSMRGFGENSFGRVLVLVDGVKLNNPDMQGINWNAIPLAGIERIEVLDGSASVQYGNSAVGGVINIITKKDGRRRTALNLAGGSFFSNRESLSHFQPLSWGNFSITAEHTGTKGWRERQEAQTTNVTGGANVFIGGTMTLSVNGFFSDLYYQLPGGLTKDQFEDDPKQALYADWNQPPYPAYVFNGDDENTERHFGGGAGLRWSPSEYVEVNVPLSYRGKLMKIDMASQGIYTGKTLHSAEARPQASCTFALNNMPLRLLGGVDVNYARLTADIYSDPACTVKSHDFTITAWTAGPYLTARFSPLSNLSVSAGARYDTAVFNADTNNGLADGDKTYSAFVYDGGIVFNPLENAKLYAKYAALFRYPFTDELAQSNGYGSDVFNKDLRPEKGFNAEAGASYRLGNMLDISADVFFMRLEDEIAPNASYMNVNMDPTRRLGTNISLGFRPFEWLALDASYSFVSAVFDGGVNDGKKIPLVPEHTLFASLAFTLGTGKAGPGALSFGPDCEFSSGRYSGGDNANSNDTDKTGNIFLAGAKIRYTLDTASGKFALQVTGRNLADIRYTKNVFYGAYYPENGRSVMVSASCQF